MLLVEGRVPVLGRSPATQLVFCGRLLSLHMPRGEPKIFPSFLPLPSPHSGAFSLRESRETGDADQFYFSFLTVICPAWLNAKEGLEVRLV